MKVLRLTDVTQKTGLSRHRIAELEKLELFPQRFKISLRAVGWLESEIDEWIAEHAASRDESKNSNSDSDSDVE